MRLRISIFIFVLLSNTLDVIAQYVKLVESSEMNWSGGVAGRRGTNYNFTVDFIQFKKEPVPDTIWIKNTPFSFLQVGSTPQGTANIKKTIGKKSVQYSISVAISHDDYRERVIAPPGSGEEKEHKQQTAARAPVKYKGVALLSYTYKGERHYFEITGITKKLPPVNYP